MNASPIPEQYRPWAIGVALALVAVALQWSIRPLTGDRIPFVFMLPAVALAASSWNARARNARGRRDKL
jgi:hypothetical protein